MFPMVEFLHPADDHKSYGHDVREVNSVQNDQQHTAGPNPRIPCRRV
jgi:hypothetical protein